MRILNPTRADRVGGKKIFPQGYPIFTRGTSLAKRHGGHLGLSPQAELPIDTNILFCFRFKNVDCLSREQKDICSCHVLRREIKVNNGTFLDCTTRYFSG